jgi:hypothetical protein
MNSIGVAVITFTCAFGGALIGLLLCSVLPQHHLSKESKDAIKMGAGLIATLTALVLGLLISSAKDSFDTMNGAMTQGGTKIILLDRTLAGYGPEVSAVRDQLRRSVVAMVATIWSKNKNNKARLNAFESAREMEDIQRKLRGLTPQNDFQRSLQSQAINISNELLQARWLAIEQAQISLPAPFFGVLLFWLAALFASIGLLASRNGTVFVVLFVCAISVAGAVFLIHEMNGPLAGMIKVSKAPLLKVLDHLGK